MSYPEWMVDKRVVGRYIAKGLVSEKDLHGEFAKLPDREENAVYGFTEGDVEAETAVDSDSAAPESESAAPDSDPSNGAPSNGTPFSMD